VRRNPEGWSLSIGRDAEEIIINCSFLVDATGQSAFVSRAFRIKRIRFDNMIGIVGVYGLSREPDPFLVVEAVEKGWWYSVPLSQRRLLVGFMTDGDIASESGGVTAMWWTRELTNSVHTAKRVCGLELADSIQTRPASTGLLEKISGHGWLAVGDAASTYDPLSGAGIMKALHFAPAAANGVASALETNRESPFNYANTVKRDFSVYLEQRLGQYKKEQRWPESVFWLRRHAKPSHPSWPTGS
jgi:flavin-dependent dehydrogenase